MTVAERPLDPADYPDADPDAARAGIARLPQDGRPGRPGATCARWWRYVPGAFWRKPEGPGSTAAGRQRHPVTHVAYEDAAAYAAWAGKALATEAEWERAARGGLEDKVFAWGDEFAPSGRLMANTWQGEFPWQNLRADGYEGTSPVATFAPNGYGLYDMTGNVWEWTADYWATHNGQAGEHACCAPGVPARREHRAPGHQGRLAPVRPQLLPALPSRGAPGRGRRHLDDAHRLSLRAARPRSRGRLNAIRPGRRRSAAPCPRCRPCAACAAGRRPPARRRRGR